MLILDIDGRLAPLASGSADHELDGVGAWVEPTVGQFPCRSNSSTAATETHVAFPARLLAIAYLEGASVTNVAQADLSAQVVSDAAHNAAITFFAVNRRSRGHAFSGALHDARRRR